MDYFKAKNLAQSGRKGTNTKRLENNTYAIDRTNEVGIRLHRTDVVRFFQDGSIVLNSGGWNTVTTKDRMNRYSPFRIQSVKGLWSVWHDGRFLGLFKDGMRIAKVNNYWTVTKQNEANAS